MENRRDNILKILGDCMTKLTTARQYEEVFDTVVYSVTAIYKCQTCAIILINTATEYLNIVNNFGLSHTFCNEFRKRIATGAIGRLLWTGKPIVITDSHFQPELSAEIQLEHPFTSCICLQMAIDQRTIGYFYVDSTNKEFLKEDDVNILRMFSEVASLAYFKYKISEENVRLDTIDRETGAEKYTAFYEKLNHIFIQAQKGNEEFSILLLDVDNIKSINKTYGQTCGLTLMRQLLEVIRQVRHDTHSIARFGFDEYIFLEPLKLKDAIGFARTLKSAVEAAQFTEQRIHTTISIGIASYPQNARSVDDLIITVKNALFDAQRSGTNCICHYEKAWYDKESCTITR